MDIWIQRFKNAKPINKTNKVIIPGEPSAKWKILEEKRDSTNK